MGNELFWPLMTLGGYLFSVNVCRKAHLVCVPPLLLATVIMIVVLRILDVPYVIYSEDVSLITALLGPSVVALAIPLHSHMRSCVAILGRFLIVICIGATTSLLLCIIFAVLLLLLGVEVDESLFNSLLPKSVTTPVAIRLAKDLDGIAELAAVFVLLSGMIGASIGFMLLDLFNIKHPAARGLALGLNAHAIGTARVFQVEPLAAPYSALAMILMCIISVLLFPLLRLALGQ
jgi:putative effector of murein hydrolase